MDELTRKDIGNKMKMLIKSTEKTGYEEELVRISKEIRKSFRRRF